MISLGNRLLRPSRHAFGLLSACVLALSAVWLSGCTTLPGIGRLFLSVHVGKPFVIVATDTGKGWGQASHPSVCRVSDTRVVLNYGVVGDGAFQGRAPVDWPAYSDDGGHTWQFGDPYNWLDGRPSNRTITVTKGNFFSYDNGLFFGGSYSTQGFRTIQGRLVKPPAFEVDGLWSEGDNAWHGPTTVSFSWETNRTLQFLCFENEATVMADGTIVSAAYTCESTNKLCSTILFASTNAGKSFSLRSIVAAPENAPWGGDGPCEPAIALLPSGELICVMRTGGGSLGAGAVSAHMLLARSSDGGKTWTHEKMLIPGVMPKLLLMSNGVLVLAFGRPGNNLIFSSDGGHTWGCETALTPADTRTSGYCDIVEVSPGRLLAVYDAHDMDARGFWLWEPKEVNGVFGVFVDVHRRFGQ